MRVVTCLVAVALATMAPGLAAQRVSGDPGIVINGRVLVKVYVTLSDEQAPYFPVVGLPLRFVRAPRDTVSVLTDDAGVASTTLLPGDYQLVATRPTTWRGRRYTWSVPITVRAGTGAIDLTSQNAQVIGGRVANAPREPAPPVEQPASERDRSQETPIAGSQTFYGSLEPSFVYLVSDRKLDAVGPARNGVGFDVVARVGIGLVSLGVGYLHTWTDYDARSAYNRISGVILEPRLELSRRDWRTVAYLFARAGSVNEAFNGPGETREGDGIMYGGGVGLLYRLWPRARANVAVGIHRATFDDAVITGVRYLVVNETHTAVQVRLGLSVR